MLWTEEGYQLNTGSPQPRHIADAGCIYPGLIGDQTDSAIANQMHAVCKQDVDTRLHPGLSAVERGSGSLSPGSTSQTPPQEAPLGQRSVQFKYLPLVLVTLWACGPASRVPVPSAQFPPQPTTDEVDIDALINSLSVRDKIAQLVVPWIAGSYAALDDETFLRMQGWIDSLHIGGLIVSVGSPYDVAAKLNLLQQRSALPLLIGSDLEAGTAIRLNGGTPFPPNMGIGATGSDSAAYELGRVTALEGRAVGIHLAFAPVADVNNNPANPIINTRSFGEDPNAVGRLVAAEIRGLQENGMLATAKHFPGHGDTGIDSHMALPVITASWARLDSVELVPFRYAITAGVASIMSAHIAMPGINGGQMQPGTVAPRILTGILRDSLNFTGLVITDALNMAGVANEFGAEAGVRAFLAGADLLLQPADPRAAIDAMAAAVARRAITPERLERSVRRVLLAKRQLGLFARRTVSLDSIPQLVGRAEFQAEARDLAARSIVLVKDVGGTVFGLRRIRPAITLVTYGEEDYRSVGNALAAELRTRGFATTVFKLWPASGPASYDSAFAAIQRSPVALFMTADRPVPSRGNIGIIPDSMKALMISTAAERPTILVSMGSPYLIEDLPEVGSYLVGWRSNSVTEQAVARALAGVNPISGRLPISIPPSYARGWGLQRRLP